MTTSSMSPLTDNTWIRSAASVCEKATGAFDLLPMSMIQLVARIAVAEVFWRSSQSKLASWQTTIQLFANEYRVPVLPVETAAMLATATELTGAVLLFLGLATRLSALALLGLVTVIQVFVYPENWPDHILWASLLLLLLKGGAGMLSMDHLVRFVLKP